MNSHTGILLINIGSPDQPTAVAVKRYLKKFLSDPHVVNIPKWIWNPILYGFILPFRSKKSADLYKKIWTKEGSPLTIYSKKLAQKLKNKMDMPVELGMHYGQPFILEALLALRSAEVKKIILFPLYPQYSLSSTQAAIDLVTQQLKSIYYTPEIISIRDYADHPFYIEALCQTILKTWEKQGKSQQLLFSFHGLPQNTQNNLYQERCHLTAKLIAQKLNLEKNEWCISFQSRLGRAAWLQPYTDEVLKTFPKNGVTDIQVICPGFAVDCLETLEEIAIRGKEQFLSAGGVKFHYIAALNDTDEHVDVFSKIIMQ